MANETPSISSAAASRTIFSVHECSRHRWLPVSLIRRSPKMCRVYIMEYHRFKALATLGHYVQPHSDRVFLEEGVLGN